MSRAGHAAWRLYAASGRLAAPLAAPYLARRAARGREDPARTAEKRGVPSRAAFRQPPVWLHAVSVGESAAAMTLATRLATAGPLLVTTSTPAAAARVAALAGDGLVHQYAPLDMAPFVERFLDHWRPRAAIFTEAEVWPATLATLVRRGVQRAHINARLSDRSFARWNRRRWLAQPLFALVELALAQSPVMAGRFAALGARDVRVTGNLKFDAAPPPVDEVEADRLRQAIGARPLWLAASTHPGEEEVVVAAHRHLAAARPDVLTIIAPRHPARGEAVARLAAGAGAVTRRSTGEGPTGDIYVADTLGELGTLFSVAPIVFLGASLRPLGGHNPAEPAACGTALLTGPWHGDMFAPFLAAGAAHLVHDAAELGASVAHLLNDDTERTALGVAAGRVLEAERGALGRTMAALEPWLATAGGMR